jgi:Domain of unknown function (DUF5597)/Beta-galactosidase
MNPSSMRIPHLRKTRTSYQLIVKDKPFLMLAGELHNSSLSDPTYMSGVWPNMKAMNVNTLLGAVTWEMIEPEEGRFDFLALDQVILDARSHGMHLVLLWFGSFKNALSTYAPGWVKTDVRRFPRVHTLEAGGVRKTLELVSPLNERAWQADAKAFATLMRHLKEFDGEHSTVIMVQVENETGLLGDVRDRSRLAHRLYEEPVPGNVVTHLQKMYRSDVHPLFRKRFPKFETVVAGSTTWKEAFGNDVDAGEMFMANAFSLYVGHVAAAGKAEYPIPLYTNVWLNFDDPSLLDLQGVSPIAAGGGQAGVYPSGGAVPHTLDLWKLNSPALDFISPDLYLHDYEGVCQQYRHQSQPLFIPEQKRDEKGARRVWLAYGTYLALGCSPFGIDSLDAHASPITQHYGLLSSISKHILDAQANRPEDIMGFFFDEVDETKTERTWTRCFGDFEVTIERAFVFGKPGPGAGMVIHQGCGTFLLAGWGFQVIFKSTNPQSTFTGILKAAEKTVDAECNLRTGRVMNGDETRSGSFYIMPNADPDYGDFPIAVTIPARTCIAECTAYSIEETEDDC